MSLSLERINLPIIQKANIALWIVRADLIHPLASGNKFYKLAPTLEYAKQRNIKHLVSFGGAFSNHIHALALSAQAHGFSSIGIIRGEPEYQNNPTLRDAKEAGMQLEFVDRKTYKRRYEQEYLQQLQQRYPNALIIPEGGSNQYAIEGCMQFAEEINSIIQPDIVTVAAGTGATVAGLACGTNAKQRTIAYAVLKDKTLNQRIQGFINNQDETAKVTIEQADFGGYAKLNKELLDFILGWLDKTDILLDPIYTGKMGMRLMQQIKAAEYKQGTTIAMVHSGGLQGWRGMQQRVIHLDGQKSWDKIQAYLCRDIA
jgi:1-aminocyclopropane-1-carboxylate deaminase